MNAAPPSFAPLMPKASSPAQNIYNTQGTAAAPNMHPPVAPLGPPVSTQPNKGGDSGHNTSPTRFAHAGVTQGVPAAGYLGSPSHNTSSSSMMNGPGVSQQMPPHLGKKKLKARLL